jgi:hypothetical protein
VTKPNSGIPLGQWSGADATNALRETIERFNEKAAQQAEAMLKQSEAMVRQTEAMLNLTWVVAGLAVVQILIGIWQGLVTMHEWYR